MSACGVAVPIDTHTLVIDNHSYSDCIFLRAAKISDNGLVKLFFQRKRVENYSWDKCPSAVISAIETYPKKKVVGVEDLASNGDFYFKFSVYLKPDTNKLYVSTTDQSGLSTKLKFDLADVIARAFELSENKHWMSEVQVNANTQFSDAARDFSPPKIQLIDEVLDKNLTLIVEEYTKLLRGKVSDDVGVQHLLVNGKKTKIEDDGTFAAKLQLGLGKNLITIVAEDFDSNVTKREIMIARREFIIADDFVDVDIPPKTGMSNPNAVAVVIGIENYQYVPDASYAYNDAEVFREYLAETLGLKRQRIKLVTNNKATRAEFEKLLGPNGWAARNIVKGVSDVIVYYSGHGLASFETNLSGLLPYDVDPNYSIGVPTDQLLQNLAKMGARSVTVILDTCFAGQTRNSEMLIADSRPIVIKPLKANVPENFTLLSAVSGSQTSGAFKNKKHGLFTYYLLAGLAGNADADRDNVITLGELDHFLVEKVREHAALDGREQEPEIRGRADEALLELR